MIRATALLLATIGGLLLWTGLVEADITWLGPNVLANPGFEQADAQDLPADWTPAANPPTTARFTRDTTTVLVGKAALHIALPDQGSASMRSAPVAVEGGREYLFSVGFRAEGFGPVGKYSGVDASMAIEWLDTAGKAVGRSGCAAFPYNASDWDLRDSFVTAPAATTRAVVTYVFANRSREVANENIPSAMWLDGLQLRRYDPPATPEWATRKVPRIVEGGISTSPVQAYQPASWNMAGGKWSQVVTDPQASYDSVITSPEGVGAGMMAHSPYWTGTPPGLYRVLVRCKVADTARAEKAGMIDVGSELAALRAGRDIHPRDFTAPNQYQELALDFIVRTPGYWMVRLSTAGNQPFTVDCVKLFPLVRLSDNDLLSLYPGSEGAVPPDLRPKHDGAFTGLLLAGPLSEVYRLNDAFHLTDYEAKLDTVWGSKSWSQSWSGFPTTPEALFKHDVIVLCDVEASALTLRQKHMLSEYVRRGGGLVFMGGHKTLERGNFAGSLLEELLPVSLQPAFAPLVHFPQGRPLARGDAHPTTQMCDFAGLPAVYFVHEVQVKPGAAVILTAGDRPAVVVGTCGRGRVACVAATAFGGPPTDATATSALPFWQWRSWPTFLRDLLWWTAGQDQRFATQ